MAHQMATAEAPQDVHDHPPTTIRQYVLIGVFLTVITAVELWVSYGPFGGLKIPILIILSAVKFATVVALFMHLRFDYPLFTRLFVFGLVLAAALMMALIALFWNDATHVSAAQASALTQAAQALL